jgi:hypothetical protein
LKNSLPQDWTPAGKKTLRQHAALVKKWAAPPDGGAWPAGFSSSRRRREGREVLARTPGLLREELWGYLKEDPTEWPSRALSRVSARYGGLSPEEMAWAAQQALPEGAAALWIPLARRVLEEVLPRYVKGGEDLALLAEEYWLTDGELSALLRSVDAPVWGRSSFKRNRLKLP